MTEVFQQNVWIYEPISKYDINRRTLSQYCDLGIETIDIALSSKSPLRYPGGKSRAVDIISKLIPRNVKKLCSPFFGGGSVELACAAKGIKVYGYDVFAPLVEFWACLQENSNHLASEVEKYYPLPKKKFYELQNEQTNFTDKFQRASVFYVLNRSSFSGSTLSGGMSPDHPRFTQSSIQRLRDFYNPNFEVNELDFKKSIDLHCDTLLYLDPPYLIKNNLYGKKGDTHKCFDHKGLAEILKERDNWILSYNNCPEIQELYKDYKILYPNWKYGMSADKYSNEVLIISKDLEKYNSL
jgi:DNA adenine methylase